MLEFIRSVLLIAVVVFAAPKAIREMTIWERQTMPYRKRKVHEFTAEEGAMHAE